MQECTSRTRATLVSFGERMSTRIFSSYLRSMGVRSKQYDAFDQLGFVTTDEFENGNILDETYPNVCVGTHPGQGEPLIGRRRHGFPRPRGEDGRHRHARSRRFGSHRHRHRRGAQPAGGVCVEGRGRRAQRGSPGGGWRRWRWRFCRSRRRPSWRTSARRCFTRSRCARRWTRIICACG